MDESEELSSAVSVHAGFPNPAGDKSLGELDLNRLLIRNPPSTFLFRVRGEEWGHLGIFDGDIALIDRGLDARKGDLVIWWDERAERFAISKHASVKTSAAVWGVVTAVIHEFRKQAIASKP